MNSIKQLLSDVSIAVLSPRDVCGGYIADIRKCANDLAKRNDRVIARVTTFVHAITFPYSKREGSAVLFVDTTRYNPLYVHTDETQLSETLLPEFVSQHDISTAQLFSYLSGCILPNMSEPIINAFLDRLHEYVNGTTYDAGNGVIAQLVSDCREKTELKRLYPRHNSNTLSIVKSVFDEFGIDELVPSDIPFNREKIWNFYNGDDTYPVNINIRHAVRRIDPGLEIYVHRPGFERIGFNVETFNFN